ncbi:hypothetical protein [Streptomyces chartreusis]|uniref:hypothetical protein n=1 Tax=Streptomyces chartreusis TaxID=1969 RepID=UPI002E185991
MNAQLKFGMSTLVIVAAVTTVSAGAQVVSAAPLRTGPAVAPNTEPVKLTAMNATMSMTKLLRVEGLNAKLRQANGEPLVGQKVTFYAADGTELASGYTDAAGEVKGSGAPPLGPPTATALTNGGYAYYAGDATHAKARSNFAISPGVSGNLYG